MPTLRMSISIFSLMSFAKNKGFICIEAESIGLTRNKGISPGGLLLARKYWNTSVKEYHEIER